MRHAYALLGLAFIIVFGGAYFLFHQSAEAPTHTPDVEESIKETNNMSLTLTSSAFSNGEMIPTQYTCDGDNVSPPLSISNIPEGTISLVLVMDDPDIPQEIKEARGIEKFNHWAIYNLDPNNSQIPAGESVSLSSYLPGLSGLNSAGSAEYTGPCPPTEYEPTTHRYIFRLYALSGQLNFIKAPTLDEVETAAKGMMIEKAELTGLYSRVKE